MRRHLAKLTGLRAMVASAFLFAAMAALVKAAARTIPTVEVVFVRNLVHAALFVPIWWSSSDRTLGNKRLLILRGVLGLLALECYAWTLGEMELADAWILQAMNPVFVALLAPWILRERSAGHVWIALALGLGGAMLVTRPGFHVGWWSGLVGLLGGLFAGLAYITVRVLGKSERPINVVMAFPVIAGPLSLPFAIPVWVWPSAVEWTVIVAAALAAAGGQILLTIGLKSARAAPASTATYAGFVFAAAIGWACFAEPLRWTSLLGALTIFVGVALLHHAGDKVPTAPPSEAPVVEPTATTET